MALELRRVPPPRYFGKRGCKPLKTNDGRWKKRDKRLQAIESRAVRAHTSGEIGALPDKLRCEFSGSEARKGVRSLAGYFMGYYTIWLAVVKRFFCPVLGNSGRRSDPLFENRKGPPAEPHQSSLVQMNRVFAQFRHTQ